MKNLDTTLAKIVFVLCLIAWMLWPKQVGAQTVYPAITSEAAKYNDSDFDFTQSGRWVIDADTIGIGAIKKDTILVAIACKRRVSETFANHASGSAFHVSTFDALEVKVLRQERTLEWQRVWLPSTSKNWVSTDTYVIETKWVVTETNWLDSTDGCYQLTPLTNE